MTMPREQRAYIVAMCAIIGSAFAYAACEWGGWPKLYYMPLRNDVAFSTPQAVSVGYPGIIAWGLGGVAVGALAGAILCRAVPRPWPARTLRLFGAWAITAVLLAGGYYTWGLWPW